MSRGVAERRSDFERAITLGTGKPIDYARAEVGRTVGVLALAAEEVKRFGQSAEPIDFEAAHTGSVGIVERFPIGPIAAIAPFNFPLNLVTHKVAPAIATGNTMVVKPPPQCPGPALMLAELAADGGPAQGRAQRHLGRPAGRRAARRRRPDQDGELHRQREGRMGAQGEGRDQARGARARRQRRPHRR